MQVAVVLHPWPWKEIGSRAVARERVVLGADVARRAHAVVDHLVAVFVGAIEHHGAAATGAAHPWLEHAERKGGGNHRIDAVAALSQYLRADLGCLARLRSDDTAFGADARFADVLGVAELVWHDDLRCVAGCVGAGNFVPTSCGAILDDAIR